MTAAASSRIHDLLDELGIHADPQLFELALTHRSWAYEHGAAPHNERLEFLGDAVLGVVVTEYLYLTFPDHPEGRLAKLRSAVVNTYALADVGRELGIGGLIRLGKGELATGGADKSSILADTMEALIGAIFLSAGRDAASLFVHTLFDHLVQDADALGAGLDWKTSLQELCALRGLPAPVYLHTASGPDHDKRFTAQASVGGRVFDGTLGRSKKQAEQGAAKTAFLALQADEG
ncbi:ribonuclease III [Nigerium massiliense]|uniref:ribonuclease III n=1 Tax=Nigerium massiliense TaxID=1522317 RepID=UPI00058C1414|nr:ribonuclease III [Nigerium massiliense]